MMCLRVPIATCVALCAPLLVAATVVAETPDPLDEARSLHVAGQWREALAAYARVVASGEPGDAAKAHNNACTIYNRLAEYPAALEACREALALRRELGDEHRLGRTLNNLGLTLQRLGRFDEAERSYREALAINRRLGDLEAQLINRQNLGLTATEAGRYAEALELFTGAEDLAAEHGGEAWAARQGRLARLNHGVVLEKLGAYREALELYLELAKEKDQLSPGHWASLQVNLGVMYRNLGDPVRAVAAFEEAAAAYQQLGDPAALSNATLNLGLAWHLNLGRPEDAEAAYREALELARSSGDRGEEIQDLFYLGRLLLDLARLDEAEEVFGQCLEAAEDAGSAEGRWSALYGLGRVAAERGRRRQALQWFERAIDEIEAVRAGLSGGRLRSGYFGDKRPVYAAAVEELAGLEREEPKAGHRHRALELVQRIKARELLESLGEASLETGRQARPLAVGELTAVAERGLLVEYFAGRDRLFRWTLDGRDVRLDDLGPARTILDRVLAVHRSLAAGKPLAAEALAELSATLLAGLEKDLVEAPKAWIAPDGILHYLPFEILPLPAAGGAPLVESSEISYLPSASALGSLGERRRPADTVLAGFGDPSLRGAGAESLSGRFAARFGLLPLPAAARELAAISELLGGAVEISTGDRATEEALRQAAARGARIFHLATHTVVDELSEQGAAILLSPAGDDDGLLRPSEIAALDLHCELTVLAACRSALGGIEDGRAFASLTGSFLAAGSSAVVASLWDVGDEASAAFMTQFYYQLGRGHSPASALRQAKQRLRADPAWNRPEVWAAFILIGDASSVASRWRIPAWTWVAAAFVVGLWAWRRLR